MFLFVFFRVFVHGCAPVRLRAEQFAHGCRLMDMMSPVKHLRKHPISLTVFKLKPSVPALVAPDRAFRSCINSPPLLTSWVLRIRGSAFGSRLGVASARCVSVYRGQPWEPRSRCRRHKGTRRRILTFAPCASAPTDFPLWRAWKKTAQECCCLRRAEGGRDPSRWPAMR